MRTLIAWLTFACAVLPTATSAEEIATRGRPTICSMDQLVRMDKCELLALYTNAEAGPIPHGFTPSRAIFNPGRPLTMAKAQLVSKTVWQGKIFLDNAHMINRVFGCEAINAAVYRGESWFDGKPSIIIDYKDSGKLVTRYRDEFREVSPGIYLGLTHERHCPEPVLKVFFALDARDSCR